MTAQIGGLDGVKPTTKPRTPHHKNLLARSAAMAGRKSGGGGGGTGPRPPRQPPTPTPAPADAGAAAPAALEPPDASGGAASDGVPAASGGTLSLDLPAVARGFCVDRGAVMLPQSWKRSFVAALSIASISKSCHCLPVQSLPPWSDMCQHTACTGSGGPSRPSTAGTSTGDANAVSQWAPAEEQAIDLLDGEPDLGPLGGPVRPQSMYGLSHALFGVHTLVQDVHLPDHKPPRVIFLQFRSTDLCVVCPQATR
jgi:hypothetical protein